MTQKPETQVALRKPDFSRATFVDFDVEREDWNRYRLSDKTILRAKVVFSGFVVNEDVDALVRQAQPGKTLVLRFGFRSTVVYGVEAPTNLRGPPDEARYTSDELKGSVVEKVEFETIKSTWNSYLLSNGMKFKARFSPTSICRTSKLDSAGIPVYYIESGYEMSVELPESRQEIVSKPISIKKRRAGRSS